MPTLPQLTQRAEGSPFVSVIVVAYNSDEFLQKCVDGLATQSMGEFEAIIVDNASTDSSVKDLRIPDHRFRVVPAGQNLGFAAGCNLGIRISRAEWIATLNPDAVPNRDWLAALRRATQRHPNVVMFGSTQVDAADPTRLDGCGDVYSFLGLPWRSLHGRSIKMLPPEGEVFSPCAAAALYRRDVLERVGGFDQAFFCYCEDIDLGFRIRIEGGRCVQVPDAVVHHVGSAIAGRNSDFTLYHSARNRVWVMVKNLPFILLVVLLPLHLAYMAWFIWRRRDSEMVSPTVAGLRAAFRGIRPLLQARRQVQRRRVISVQKVARMLCWSLAKLRRMEPDVRALPATDVR